MTYVKSFRDLEVYKLAREVSKEVYILTKSYPVDEKYSLTDQIRRSSRSVGAQIAESWGKRKYELHFISKLSDADSEQLETQLWIEISREYDYINSETSESLMQKCEAIGKMIQSMIDKSSTFCMK
jgi:four helix bundle protein